MLLLDDAQVVCEGPSIPDVGVVYPLGQHHPNICWAALQTKLGRRAYFGVGLAL
jgi:hypothetical protein